MIDPNSIITLKVALTNPTGGQVSGEVKIRDEIALSKFSDRKINKMLVDNERRQGNKNISYDVARDMIIERFPLMSKEQIMEKIMKEMKSNGGRIK
jgi:hypothetical protein